MKKIYSLAFILLNLSIMISCSDSNVPANFQASLSGHSLSIGNNILSFDAQGGTINTTVNTNNIPWQFSGLPEWLTVSPISGNSTSSVTFTATENVSTDITRTCIFYLESKEQNWSYKTPVSASQEAATAYITPATTSITFSGSQGSENIAIQSNTTWEAKSSVEWIKTEVSADYTTLTISVESNPTDVSRSATVTLSSAGRTTANIQVIQEAAGVTGSTETLSFEKDGGTMSTTITAETKWETKTSSSWITVSPTSGDAGSHTLYITVTENSSVSERLGYVYVVVGASNKLQIPVKQKGLFIESTTNSLSFTADAEQKQITVNSNFDWTVLTSPEWLTISPMYGRDIQTITVSSQKNENSSSRRGTIVMGKEGLSISANIEVVQEGMTISVDNNNMEFTDKASSQDITITTIAEWNVISHDNWIHLSKTNGIGNSVLSVSVDENTSENSRTGIFTINAGDLTQTITVIQSGKYFNIDTGDKTFTSTGGTMQISFSTNENWTASFAENVSWLSLSSTSGSGDGVINITASNNASMMSRENTIIITPANSQGIRIAVKQNGRYLTASTSTIHFGRGGGNSENVIISTDGTYTINKNASWFSIDKTSDSQFIVKADPNEGSGRNGKIVITMTGLLNNEMYSIDIDVEQAGNDLTGYVNGHAYVDMGLPSGTLWARVNIGANSPTDAGIYFQWGGINGGNEGNPGTTINTSIQGTKNDAATTLWGKKWCIPSKEQVNELLSHSDIELITQNGVNGYRLTSRYNGLVLFLPAERESPIFYTSYWTSDYSQYNNGYAYTLSIQKSSWGASCSFTETVKSALRPIRAVTK